MIYFLSPCVKTHKYTTSDTHNYALGLEWRPNCPGRVAPMTVKDTKQAWCSSLQDRRGGRQRSQGHVEISLLLVSIFLLSVVQIRAGTLWLAGIWTNNVNRTAGLFVSKLAKPLRFTEICTVVSKTDAVRLTLRDFEPPQTLKVGASPTDGRRASR